jgi:(2Fe-2S) ferredoxin
MDKLPSALREKFLRKKATSSSAASSGASTPRTITSGTESQSLTPPKTPSIPFPLSDLDECLACSTPCTPDEHAEYPGYIVKSIDRELPLAGSIKPYGRHFLISTGRNDWVHSIDEEEGSLAQAVFRGLYVPKFGGRKREGEERIVMSNTSFPPRRMGSAESEVVLLPEWRLVNHVSAGTASAFVSRYVDHVEGGGETAGGEGLESEILPFHSIVLICSHGKRDKRCGVTSKYLVKAFESELRKRDIYRSWDDTRTEAQGGVMGGGTVVGCLSHIGGHKFAGNVIVYRRRGRSVSELHDKLRGLSVEDSEETVVGDGGEEEVSAEGIWLGRVEPKHVEAIIEEVILKGRVFKELYRGGLPSKYADLQF